MGTGSRRAWNTGYVGGQGKWGWGTARDYRETMRNRGEKETWEPGSGASGWVGGGGSRWGWGGWGWVEVAEGSATVGERKGRKGWQRDGNNETPYKRFNSPTLY